MNSINKNGCSVCAPGKENYCTYNIKLKGKKVRMYQYDYRAESGELFTCCAATKKSAEKNVISGLVYNNKTVVVYQTKINFVIFGCDSTFEVNI